MDVLDEDKGDKIPPEHALEDLDPELRDDKTVVIEALTLHGGCGLRFASKRLRGDRDVVRVALEHKGARRASDIWNHVAVGSPVLGDIELARMAIQDDSSVLLCVSHELQMDPELVALAWDFQHLHDYDLFEKFGSSRLCQRYVWKAVALHKEVLRCGKQEHWSLEDPAAMLAFAERWRKESLEKQWLIGKLLLQTTDAPLALCGTLLEHSGISKDLAVATRLLRLASVLRATKEGLWKKRSELDANGLFGKKQWEAFVRDATRKICRLLPRSFQMACIYCDDSGCG